MKKSGLRVLGGVSRNNMKERIERAKQKAEAEFEKKIQKSQESDVDVREIFTDVDFDAICENSDYFNGKVADMPKAQRYKKVELAAKWLEANSIEVVAIEVEPISKERPNAIITIDIRRLASFKGEELRVFTMMNALADTVFISGVKDSTVRFTFGIEDVWREK